VAALGGAAGDWSMRQSALGGIGWGFNALSGATTTASVDLARA
jgi:hypothetical protein